MKYLMVTISNEISEEEAESSLRKKGFPLIFSSFGEMREMACVWKKGWQELPLLFPWISHINEEVYHGIDWNEQWRLHAPSSYDGSSLVNLKEFGFENGKLLLSAGPGFGDLSHPTTRLTLRLMSSYVNGALCIDIGCGSGILSIAALVAGAHHAIAIDIDNEALEHTKYNASLNSLAEKIDCHTPTTYPSISRKKRALFTATAPGNLPGEVNKAENTLITMNMIHSEQRVAWDSLKDLIETHHANIITSGILLEGRAEYLEEVKKWGWQLIDECEEEKWCAFVFK